MPTPPKFQPRRRNATVGPLVLPAAGRKGRAPAWPIGKGTPAERALWSELWHTPQAAAWEALGWTRVVARYARMVLAAEEFVKEAMPEARQLEDRLGLTPKAMRLLMWTIAPTDDEVPAGKVVTPDRWRQAAG